MSLSQANKVSINANAPVAGWRLTSSLAVGLAIYVLLMCVASRLLNDPDSQWHVAVGRWIWANGRVPTADPFSHTFLGTPWIAKEWGSQLILFAAYKIAGWLGVVVISATAIAMAFALLDAWLYRLRASVALALTLFAFLLCASHLLARPHALALPVMVLWLTQLVAAREREEAPPMWVALLMVLWTNLHGSFPLGIALAALMAAEGVLLGARDTLAKRLRNWALFLVAATAATLVTPYGWQAALVPFQMIGKGEDLSFIGEWRPLAFDWEGVLALALGVFSLWALSSAPRANIFRIVATLLLAAMMIRHGRFVDQFALLTPVLFANSLARRPGFAPDPDDRPNRVLPMAIGALAVGATIATARAAPRPNSEMTPDSALNFVRAHHIGGLVYNAYDFGGFLIANGVPTFIDGRTDQLFLGGFLHDLDKARDDEKHQNFRSLLDRYNVAWALVRPSSPDVRHLGALPGWSRLYQDDTASVFKRDR